MYMALTKTDLQQIGGLLDKQTENIKQMFRDQNEYFSKVLLDLGKHLEGVYASKEEMEQLRNKVEELEDEIVNLKRKYASITA